MEFLRKKPAHQGLAALLAGLVMLVAFLHVAFIVFKTQAEGSFLAQQANMFDLDGEFNVPAIYNGFLWALSAFMAALLAMQVNQRGTRLIWGFLAVLFFYFGFDELLVLHEQLARPVRDLLSIGDGSVFYHAWIIPAIAVTLAIAIMYLVIRRRPKVSTGQKKVLKLLVLLAFGVILLEAVGTQIYFSEIGYKLGPVMIEELFEISMVSIILYTMTSYILPESKKS